MTAQGGFTLIESLVAVAVAVVLLAAAVPGMQTAFERRRLDGAAAQLAADLRYARAEAVARNRTVRVSFQADGSESCYLIHTGPVTQCSCTGARPACDHDASLVRGVVINHADRLAVRANVASIAFDPLHGTATPTATVQAVGASGDAVDHVVNVLGRVRSCSPGGAVPGWTVC